MTRCSGRENDSATRYHVVRVDGRFFGETLLYTDSSLQARMTAIRLRADDGVSVSVFDYDMQNVWHGCCTVPMADASDPRVYHQLDCPNCIDDYDEDDLCQFCGGVHTTIEACDELGIDETKQLRCHAGGSISVSPAEMMTAIRKKRGA